MGCRDRAPGIHGRSRGIERACEHAYRHIVPIHQQRPRCAPVYRCSYLHSRRLLEPAHIRGAPHRDTSGATGSIAHFPERTPAPRARANATPGEEQVKGSSVLMRTRSGTSYRHISPAELLLERSPVRRHHVATSTFGTETGLIVFTRRICAHAGTSCHRRGRPLLGRNVFLLRPLLGLIVFHLG